MLERWFKQLETMLGYITGNLLLQAILLMAGFWFIAYLIDRFFVSWVKKLIVKTDGYINSYSVEYLHRPLFVSVLLVGLYSTTLVLKVPGELRSPVFSLIATIAIYLWAKFFLQVTRLILKNVARNPNKADILHPHTLPLFENIAFILIVGFAIYYIFINWNIDMTAWLASAGIIGIAVGFAAKDTLANLISGVFIMADAPYKLGDFVVLDSGERGEVTKIGIRSTRLLTRDDIEITVPNAVMGNTKIINESGGRHEKYRIRIQVGVAYGSDIDKVRDILLSVGNNSVDTCTDPVPRVRFRSFGTSSLDFELLCWIEHPVLRGMVVDNLNCAVYKAFIESGVEIPYSKQDIYIKEMPPK